MNCIRCGRKFEGLSGPCPDCQWNPNARQKPLAGYLVGERVNGRFAIREAIGMGRLGAVLKAVDLKTQKAVALKCIHPALIPDEDVGSRFLACMRVHQESNTSGLARIIDVGRDSKNYYVAREMIYGVSFKQLLEDQQISGQPFPLQECVEIIQQIARILSDAKGLAHGTFSPSKVWVIDQRIQITDFGLAASLPPDAVWHCMRRKRNRYLAPEYIDNRPPDAAGDVYALGIMLGEMLSLAEFNGRVEVFRESEPDFLIEIEALLRCALSQDVDVRYTDAKELVAALYDVTGYQRTKTMPPDNTAVVPAKFLSTLRSMSETPPPSSDGEAPNESSRGMISTPAPLPTEDILDEIVEDDDLLEDEDEDADADADEDMKVITRQMPLTDVMEPLSDEDDLGFLDDIQPDILDDDDDDDDEEEEDDEDDYILDAEPLLEAESPAAALPALTPPPFRPSDEGGAPEGVRVSVPPPLPKGGTVKPPIPRPTMPPAFPKGEASIPVAAGDAMGMDAERTSGASPRSAGRSVPPRLPRERSSDAGDDELYKKFEGINPRFLRAAAKLEKARTVEPEEKKRPSRDEDDWRRQLEKSAVGSVISFLPPSNGGDASKQQNKSQARLSKTEGVNKSKPPPLPTRRK